MQLVQEPVLSHLQPGGTVSRHFPLFEPRAEQIEMLKDVLEAYNSGKVALIEAGTGCGKSMAYLLPALLFAATHNEKSVISTNTINLQEQLLHKDIPLLLKALNLDLKVVLVKGMNNYICLRKLNEAMDERPFYTPEETAEVESLSMKLRDLVEGSRHELSFTPSPLIWERVGAERDTCTHSECPHFQECYFFKARKEVQEAQILIVNHHLLFADITLRAQSPENQPLSILPPYQRVVIDEAHNIEDIATDYFAKKMSRLQILKTLGRLLAEKGSGKLPLLKDKIAKHFIHGFPEEVQGLINRFKMDLPTHRKEIALQLKETFDAIGKFLAHFESPDEDIRFRFRTAHAETPLWKEEVLPRMENLIKMLLKFEQSLKSIDEDVEALENERLNETTKGLRHEIKALAARLSASATTLESLIQPQIAENQVRWIEHSSNFSYPNTSLIDASLDLSQLFVEQLFSRFKTVVLASATLTTGKKFDFFRDRFGLTHDEIRPRLLEKIYPSPFNYGEQALLAIPNDLPLPDHKDFLEEASKRILDTLEASRGGAFILFTSYSMMNRCYELMKKSLTEKRFNLFKQGERPRNLLLNQFMEKERAVLFGTDSFWEGVDVAGDKLRAVIIVKLPFKVPSEPIVQARMERLLEQGKDPFKEFSLPQAIVKFKQGFGRLIRSKKDRGVVVILDKRLLAKNYGKEFLASLPKCREAIGPSEAVRETQRRFFFHARSQTAPQNERASSSSTL